MFSLPRPEYLLLLESDKNLIEALSQKSVFQN